MKFDASPDPRRHQSVVFIPVGRDGINQGKANCSHKNKIPTTININKKERIDYYPRGVFERQNKK